MVIPAVISSIIGWFIGLVLDANLDMGSLTGFLELRVLFPILIMGAFLLHTMEKGRKE